MSEFQSDIFFVENPRLDLDSDPRNAKGWRANRNLEFGTSDDAHVGALQQRKGNLLISNSTPEDSKTIGEAKDYVNGTIIYMVYNSNPDNNKILEYNPFTDTITEICGGDFLPFSLNALILNPRIIYYNTGRLLYWTDGTVYPCKINLDKAHVYTSVGAPAYIDPWDSAGVYVTNDLARYGGDIYKFLNTSVNSDLSTWQNMGTGYGELDQQTIDLIKYPPTTPPTYTYETDATFTQNLIDQSMYQFRYRWIYDDNEPSALGFISKVVNPNDSEYYSYNTSYGLVAPAPAAPVVNVYSVASQFFQGSKISSSENNRIDVVVNTGHSTVRYIEVFVRKNNDGKFYKWKTIDKYTEFYGTGVYPDDTNIVVSFFGNEDSVVVSDAEAAKQFDLVPQVAGCLDVLYKNNLLLGDCTEDYDNVVVDISLSQTQTQQPLHEGDETGQICICDSVAPYYQVNAIIAGNTQYFLCITLPSEGDLIGIVSGLGIFTNYILQAADVASKTAFCTKIKSLIDTNIDPRVGGVLATSAVVATPIGGETGFAITTTISIYLQCYLYSKAKKYSSFKSQADHIFGIVYYDRANRSGAVNTNLDTCKLFVSVEDVFTGVSDQVSIDKITTIDWQIKHLPPSWATHYQWVYTKNTRTAAFVEYDTLGIRSESSGKLIVQLNSFINYVTKNSLSIKTNVLPGDIINVYDPNHSQKFSLVVISFDATTSEALCQYSIDGYTNFFGVDSNTTPILSNINALVEIYTPLPKTEDLIFYEFGDVYRVISGFETPPYHEGPDQDQDPLNPATIPAKGSFTDGDIWIRRRKNPVAYVLPTGVAPNQFYGVYPWPRITGIEDFSYSDFYSSKACSQGRINKININAEQKRLEYFSRFSNQILPEASINGLSTFDANNFKSFPVSYGAIVGFRNIGDILKVVQNFGYISVYVGKRSIYNAEGSNSVVLTDGLLQNEYDFVSGYGCFHPESISVAKNRLFFFDVNKGCWLQDVGNGLDEFSKYYTRKYWQQKGQDIKDRTTFVTSPVRVFSQYNPYSEKIVCAVTDIDQSLLQTTMMFDSEKNDWMGNYDFENFDMMSYVGQAFVSFLNGDVYKHYAGDINTFYGQLYNSKIKVAATVNPKQIVTWKSISIHANKKFYAEDGGVTITLNGYSGRIPSGKWQRIQKAWFATFGRNMSNPNFLGTQNLGANSEEPRGEYIEVELTNVPDSESAVLYNISIKSIDSPYSY